MIPEAEKVVYFVRHGESVDNTLPVFQSEDTPLSPRGAAQAKLIGERISHLDFDALISSPYPRAADTARAIAERTGKQISFSDLFVERRKPKSIWGKPWSDQQAESLWRGWEDSLYGAPGRVEDGENYSDILARADKALSYLVKRAEHSLVVVSHGHFMRTLLARIMLGDYLSGPILRRIQSSVSNQNTGISVLLYKTAFEEDVNWRLWTHNDHAHFAE